MASACKIVKRSLSTSAICNGKRNFNKFMLYNKRGPREFKERQAKNPDPEMPFYKRGVRDIGYTIDDKFYTIQEKVPELIVPDLKGFKLKPYVSYRSTDVVQSEFTPKDLFEAIYANKIKDDFEKEKLTPQGEPLEPSEDERLTAQEARDRAGKTGADIF